MDLEFDERQQVIRDTTREFFEKHCPLTRVRELEGSELGFSPDLWKQMAELDWIGLTYPEKYGGIGGELLDLFAIYLEMGRALAPSPHLPSAVVSGETLLRAGSEAQKAELLPRMVHGETIVAPALLELSGEYGPEAIRLTAAREEGGYRLDGTKVLVPYAHVAEKLLVAASTGARPDGIGLFLVDCAAGGVKTERLDNIAGYPLFAVVFEGVKVEDADLVGEEGSGWSALAPALERAAVLQSAEIVGAGERMLEISVEYANDREQFGQPIGKFQAVQYLCSDIAIEVHLCELLAKQAAWAIDVGEPCAGPVANAAAHASRTAQKAARAAHEVLAGHGFMLENALQLFSRRAKYWEFNMGDARYYFDRIVATLE